MSEKQRFNLRPNCSSTVGSISWQRLAGQLKRAGEQPGYEIVAFEVTERGLNIYVELEPLEGSANGGDQRARGEMTGT